MMLQKYINIDYKDLGQYRFFSIKKKGDKVDPTQMPEKRRKTFTSQRGSLAKNNITYFRQTRPITRSQRLRGLLRFAKQNNPSASNSQLKKLIIGLIKNKI